MMSTPTNPVSCKAASKRAGVSNRPAPDRPDAGGAPCDIAAASSRSYQARNGQSSVQVLLHHLGHLLAVPFLPDEYLSYGVIQLFKILPKLLGYFFIEFPDYIFQSVDQCPGVVFRNRPTKLVERTGERFQTTIVVLVGLLRCTAEFIDAVVTVLTRQPDLAYERRFVLTYERLLHPLQKVGKVIDSCVRRHPLADFFPAIEPYIPCL